MLFRSSLKLNLLRAKWPMGPAPILGFCSVKRMRIFDYPGRDTDPALQVSFQQTLAFIYRFCKNGKLCEIWRERKSHKCLNLGRAGSEPGA